jgi:membrane-bound lytic murein transglycosylase B
MNRSSFFLSAFLLCAVLQGIPFLLPAHLPAAEAKPKAADLVEDGQTIDLATPHYQQLFAELRTDHNYSQAELDTIFAGVTIRKRVLELMDMQWEAQPYYVYYPRFITKEMVRIARKKLTQHKDLLDRIEKELGVERQIVVAIWGIESKFGKHKGYFDLFQTLNTMFDAYPRRSKFYREQLIHFLLLCRENGVDPLSVTGSYGGAFGQTQFIPSSFREYAVDFDNDGRRDVWTSVPDVLASIANYLRRYHWTFGTPIYWELGRELKDAQLKAAYQKGRKGLVSWELVKKVQAADMPATPENMKVSIVGLELDPAKGGGMRFVAGFPNFQAITKWNNSNRYAMAVTELAEQLKGK